VALGLAFWRTAGSAVAGANDALVPRLVPRLLLHPLRVHELVGKVLGWTALEKPRSQQERDSAT